MTLIQACCLGSKPKMQYDIKMNCSHRNNEILLIQGIQIMMSIENIYESCLYFNYRSCRNDIDALPFLARLYKVQVELL